MTNEISPESLIPPGLSRDLIEQVHDGVYLVDADCRIVYWNRSAEEISGLSRDEMIGGSCCERGLAHTDSSGGDCLDHCPLKMAIAEGTEQNRDWFLQHKEGHRVPVSIRVIPIRDESGEPVGAAQIFRDESHRPDAEETAELKKLALVDPLTELGNRRYFEQQLDERLEELRRYDVLFGLILIDTDNFKRINDAHGHRAGDAALETIARSLRNGLRSSDIPARWGGDEFVALIPHTDRHHLRSVAERIRALVAHSSLRFDRIDVPLGISVGATVARAGDTAASIVDRADRLMYRGKAAGGDRVTMDDRSE